MEPALVFGYIILPLILYWRLRNLYYTRLTVRARFTLFKLKDELRLAAIQGKIDANHEMFDFLEFVIGNTVNTIERFNIYTHGVRLVLHHAEPKGKDFNDAQNRMFTAIQENPEANRIFHACTLVIRNYFLRKHYYLTLLVGVGIVVKGFRDWGRSRLDTVVDFFVRPQGVPRFSGEFAPDYGAPC